MEEQQNSNSDGAGSMPDAPFNEDEIEILTKEECIAKTLYGDRALRGPDALYRSIKDWG